MATRSASLKILLEAIVTGRLFLRWSNHLEGKVAISWSAGAYAKCGEALLPPIWKEFVHFRVFQMGLVLVSMAVADTRCWSVRSTPHGEHRRPEISKFAAGRNPGK